MNTMQGGAMPLDLWHVGMAALLVLVAGAVSLGLGLRLERQIALASARCLVQLLLVGYILRWVFGVQNPLVLLLLSGLMTFAASRAASGRSGRAYGGAGLHIFATLFISAIVTTLLATTLILRVHPWYAPQYTIPLLGMMLGNSLTGVALSLDQFLESAEERRGEVEAALALGATRTEAANPLLAGAVRRGMIPTINTMAAAGIVSLPGMMTGQILSGTSPIIAVRYQVVVLFLQTASTALACMAVTWFAFRTLLNDRHQLCLDRLHHWDRGAS